MCITAAAFLACYKELMATPASLMVRFRQNRGGVFCSNGLPALAAFKLYTKSTLRNLFRYKKRFFMTVFGIGGCMALMIVGFGLKDSIKDIVDLQYNKIQPYSGMVIMDEDAGSADKDRLYEMLDSESGIGAYKTAYMSIQILLHRQRTGRPILLYLKALITSVSLCNFNDRTTGKEYQLDDSGLS